MNSFIGWLEARVVDRRRSSDPSWVSRALRLSASSIARLPADQPKTLFQARLAEVSFIQEAVSKDEKGWSELSVPHERVRYISQDAIVTEEAFLESVVKAFRYRDSKLTDRLGRTYDVRTVGIIDAEDGHYDSVVFVREDGWVFVERGRFLPILVADLDGLLAQFEAHRESFGLTEHEAKVAAHEFVDMPATARLAQIDQLQSRAPFQFYSSLNFRIAAGETLRPSDLVQYDLQLLRPLLNISSSSWTTDLSAKASWESVFQVASALPRRLDADLLMKTPQSVLKCPELFVEWAATHGAPSAFHACDVLLSHLTVDRTTAERIFAETLSRYMLDWKSVQLKLDSTRWFLGEILRQPYSETWTAAERAGAPWIQNALISNVLATRGYGAADMLEPLLMLPQLDMFLLLDQAEAGCTSSPLQANAHDLILCATHDLTEKHQLSLDAGMIQSLREFLVEKIDLLPDGYGWPEAILGRNFVGKDPIGSYLVGDRLKKLLSLIGGMEDSFRWKIPSNEQLLLMIRDNGASASSRQHWLFISAAIIGSSTPIPEVSAELTEQIEKQSTAEALRNANPAAWCLRLMALAHTASLVMADYRVFDEFFEQSVELVVNDAHATTNDAASLIDAFAITVRSSPKDKRVERLSKCLDYMSRGSTDFARGVGATATILRDRLPGAAVTKDIASSVLKCRAVV